MMFKSYSEHSEPLFNKAKILNIEKINDFYGKPIVAIFNNGFNTLFKFF